MLPFIDAQQVQQLDDAALERELHTLGPRQQLRRGGLRGRGAAKELVAFGRLGQLEEVFPGYSWRELRDGGREQQQRGVLCHSGREIQSVVGCVFDCTYCPYTSFVSLRLDLESFADRALELAQQHPGQLLYKLNNRSDTLGLEPQYGLAAALVQRFAELEQQTLMLYSKGDAVDQLLELDHRGRTVACFTLTPQPVAEVLEPGAPPPAARLLAMGKLYRAGYPVRARISPVVPWDGWREAYLELVQQLLAQAQPEMVTLWTLSMVDVESLAEILPPDRLDPAALASTRAAADRMRGVKGAPFPPVLRADLYREIAALIRDRSPQTRVALCLETPEVWDAAAGKLVPRDGPRFSCNCGPRAVF